MPGVSIITPLLSSRPSPASARAAWSARSCRPGRAGGPPRGGGVRGPGPTDPRAARGGSWPLDSTPLEFPLDPVEPSHHLGPVTPPGDPEPPHHPRERLPTNAERDDLCAGVLFRVA